MTVAILNVNPGTVSTRFHESIRRMDDTHVSRYIFEDSHVNINHARNVTAYKFLRSGCDHAWFLDSDMVFMPDAVEQFLALDKPLIVVECVQPSRRATVRGLACVFAHRSVLEAIPSMEWFREDYTPDGWVSEDTWFFRQCEKAGFDPYIATSIPIGHHKWGRVWYPEDIL